MKYLPLLALGLTGALFAADKPKQIPADIATVLEKYPTYRKVYPEPKPIAARSAILCSMGPDGPHAGHYVQEFRDPIAATAPAGAKSFPVGSVIIKQKLRSDDPKPKVAPELDAVAGMIKRAPGTHPKSGDWEFFWSEGGKTTTARMESCAGCHSGAAKDYVFTSFPDKRAK